MVTKLVLVNFLVFVLVSLVYFTLFIALGGEGHGEALWVGLDYLAMPADWKELLWHPWTPITSMFLHQSFWHVLSNLIWLYLFGNIVGDLVGDRRVLPIYLLGGLAGALAYFVSANFLPYIGGHALGASAAVMALGGTALLIAPDYRVMLLLIGEIKLKYIVLVMVLLDLVGIANQANTGGHAAHIGGLFMGFLFVYQLRNGSDMAEPVNNLIEGIQSLFSGKKKPQMRFQRTNTARKPGQRTDTVDLSHQEKLDTILDKIKQEGYENLSAEEKEFLFHASKK
jgi:membrane associated rhomboid family serine protease